jgi:hypothetical protein
MQEHPIIFSGPMVQTILNTQPNVWPAIPIDPRKPFKWQTRRLVIPRQTKPRIPPRFMEPWLINGVQETMDNGVPLWVGFHPDYPTGEKWFGCDYGKAGDQLWVRETWCPVDDSEGGGGQWIDYRATPRYAASHPAGWDNEPDAHEALKWRPSIHMKRWMSRIQLEIKNVRVERVQAISGEDIIAEGAWRRDWTRVDGNDRRAFQQLWDAINEKRGGGWDANPYVWVIDFMRLS